MGAAEHAGRDHPALIGLGAGLFVGGAYEAMKPHPDPQDFAAAAIGSLACVSLSEGVKLVIQRNAVKVNVAF